MSIADFNSCSFMKPSGTQITPRPPDANGDGDGYPHNFLIACWEELNVYRLHRLTARLDPRAFSYFTDEDRKTSKFDRLLALYMNIGMCCPLFVSKFILSQGNIFVPRPNHDMLLTTYAE